MITSYKLKSLSLSTKAKKEAIVILKELGKEAVKLVKIHVPACGYVVYFKDINNNNVAYLNKSLNGIKLTVN